VIFILFRYGLLALATLSVMTEMTRRFYLTFDFGAWYGGSAPLAMIAVVIVSLFAFRDALAGRKLISDKMLDV
jgi:hypothetical protein